MRLLGPVLLLAVLLAVLLVLDVGRVSAAQTANPGASTAEYNYDAPIDVASSRGGQRALSALLVANSDRAASHVAGAVPYLYDWSVSFVAPSGILGLGDDFSRALDDIDNAVPRPNVRNPKPFANDGRGATTRLPTLDTARNPITYTEHTVNPRPPGGLSH